MTFDKNKFKDNYSTDKDNILKEFYIPILKESISYDRAVGYFSSQGLVKYLQGIDGLVKNNGKMRLIIGDTLSDDEYESINNSEAYSEIYSRLDKTWSDIFNSSVTELSKHRLAIFSWLLNRGFLEVRYAFRRKGLFHKKIGIVKDKKGNIVTFSGSMNETEAAMASNVNNPNGNSEEFVVFGSWDVDIFRRYGQEKVDSFNKVWEDCEDNTTTVKLPSAHYERIKDIYKNDSYPKSDSEKNQAELYDQITVNLDLDLDLDELDFSTPRLPKKIGGRKYQIQEHQVKALTDWKKSNYHGIMALATGAGKTITSIHGFVKFSETRPLALVVSVPYRVLAEQWCEVLSTFNIQAIKCYDGREKWESKLINGVGNFLLNIKKYLAVVVVNDTLRKEHFYSQINKIPSNKLFFVGDECHHHGNKDIVGMLPKADYRIGLSATPWSKRENDKKLYLESYYKGIVAEYSLQEALDNNVLTGYKYHIHPVSLNSDEQDAYIAISGDISKMYAIKNNGGTIDEVILKNLLFKRSRLLDSLEDKFNTLERLLENRTPSPYVLFYCGSGSVEEDSEGSNDKELNIKSIDRVTKILHQNGWSVSKFTSTETTRQRNEILENFKSATINAIAAIKVLDEGFDVPMCTEAYITASSRNERQFIQRRGRILRKSSNKSEAIIHDFVILPNSSNKALKDLVLNELERIFEFYSSANNKVDISMEIRKICDDYGFKYDLFMSDKEGDNVK
jgi:superfamily II DNA or RNA helicase